MTYATEKRLPRVKFKAGDRVYLDRWLGVTTGKRGRKVNRSEEVEVEILSLRHEASWNRGLDGRSIVEPPIYQVRVIATGEEFPACQSGLNRYPRVK